MLLILLFNKTPILLSNKKKIPTNKEGDIVAKSQKYVTFSSLLQVSVALQNISACQILLQQLTFRALKWVNKLIAKKNVIQTTTQTAACTRRQNETTPSSSKRLLGMVLRVVYNPFKKVTLTKRPNPCSIVI